MLMMGPGDPVIRMLQIVGHNRFKQLQPGLKDLYQCSKTARCVCVCAHVCVCVCVYYSHYLSSM